MRVAIVGGGIAGLSLAIGLASQGGTVKIFERELTPHVEGAAITLRPLAVKALRRLGVLDKVLEAGRTVDRYRIFTNSGQVFSDMDLTLEGEPTVMILRQKLIRVLSEDLEGAELRMGAWPTEVDRSGDTVDVVFSNGEQSRCDLLVGSDGIRSWVRHQLFPQAETRFVGQHYWRFCVEGELVDDWYGYFKPGRGCSMGLHPLPGMTFAAAQIAVAEPLPASPEPKDRLQRTFGDFPSPVAEVLARVSSTTEMHVGPIHEVTLTEWSSGRVGLIGDAAHAMSPILALGGGLALEDALVLAEEIGRSGPTPQALTALVERRRPRVELARRLANARLAAAAGHATIDDQIVNEQLATFLHDP
jgi:2-polyprenyl-6-methoxyphenol hydroxylase-like FAD-dependent oxidoreductase